MIINDIINNYTENLISKEKIYSAVGSVVSVDASKKICSVELLTGETIEEVRLQTDLTLNASSDIIASDPDGLVMVPKIQSNVIVTFLNNTDAFVSYFSDLSGVFMVADNYQFNEGENGGLINVVDQVSKLNGLVNELSTELLKIQTGLAGVGGAYTPGSLSQFDKDDFEDTKIIH